MDRNREMKRRKDEELMEGMIWIMIGFLIGVVIMRLFMLGMGM